jgi:hypothetical protein
MKTDQIMCCIVALLLGMLLANMLKNVCGCKNVVEGQNAETCEGVTQIIEDCINEVTISTEIDRIISDGGWGEESADGKRAKVEEYQDKNPDVIAQNIADNKIQCGLDNAKALVLQCSDEVIQNYENMVGFAQGELGFCQVLENSDSLCNPVNGGPSYSMERAGMKPERCKTDTATRDANTGPLSYTQRCSNTTNENDCLKIGPGEWHAVDADGNIIPDESKPVRDNFVPVCNWKTRW